MRTLIEPFKVKMVEPIKQTTEEERADYLDEAHNNPFLLKAEDILIDFLTDSGTGAMSDRRWGSRKSWRSPTWSTASALPSTWASVSPARALRSFSPREVMQSISMPKPSTRTFRPISFPGRSWRASYTGRAASG